MGRFRTVTRDSIGPLRPRAEGRLDDQVVRLLQRQTGRIAFNGLRRELAAHPESLTRALRRLERGGVVLRDGLGYSLADGYHRDVDRSLDRSFHPVASVELGRAITPDQVLGSLAGRWLGRLRWVGVYERSEDPWLVWSLDGTPGHVLLSVHGRTLTVGVERSGSEREGSLEEGARELLVLGLGRLPRPVAASSPGTVTFARIGGPPIRWAS
jgi:DNA-binding Lrp family transcriptional regulator